jgi:hypothetical protein
MQVRLLPPELCRRGRAGKTPGPQPGSRGFESRRRYSHLAVGEMATPPVSGTGDRRFDSCRPDLRGRGAAVPASLMSSRPWVRIPPALLDDCFQTGAGPDDAHDASRLRHARPRHVALLCAAGDRGAPLGHGRPRPARHFGINRRGGVAQRLERRLVRPEGAGSSPVVPASWWPWCKRLAPGVVSPAVPVRARSATLSRADAEHWRAQQTVTLNPAASAVVVRLHPSAPARGRSSTESTSLATRKVSVRLRPSPLP